MANASPSKAEEDNSPAGEEMASSAARELRKCHMVRRAVSIYKDIVGYTDMTESLAEKLESKGVELYKRVIKTSVGDKVDEIIADVAVKARTSRAGECFARFEKRVDSCQVMMDKGFSMMKVLFRYFLPLMLLRWAVDLSLMASEVSLALLRDLTRKDDDDKTGGVSEDAPSTSREKAERTDGKSNGTPTKGGGRGRSPASSPGQQQVRTPETKASSDSANSPRNPERDDHPDDSSTNDSRADSISDVTEREYEERDRDADDGDQAPTRGGDRRNLRPRRRSRLGGCFCFLVQKTVSTAQLAFDFLATVFLIPPMIVQVLALSRMSKFLRGCAGVDDFYCNYSRPEKQRRILIYKYLIGDSGKIRPRKLKDDEWLVDHVLDRVICELMTYFFVSRVLKIFEIKRPVQIFHSLAKSLSDQVKRTKRYSVADYLNLDSDYEEDDDPDYKPEDDISDDDDSLEYKEDEELEKDGNGKEDDHDSKAVGYEDDRNDPSRKTPEVKAQGESTEEPVTKGTAPSDVSRRAAQSEDDSANSMHCAFSDDSGGNEDRTSPAELALSSEFESGSKSKRDEEGSISLIQFVKHHEACHLERTETSLNDSLSGEMKTLPSFRGPRETSAEKESVITSKARDGQSDAGAAGRQTADTPSYISSEHAKRRCLERRHQVSTSENADASQPESITPIPGLLPIIDLASKSINYSDRPIVIREQPIGLHEVVEAEDEKNSEGKNGMLYVGYAGSFKFEFEIPQDGRPDLPEFAMGDDNNGQMDIQKSGTLTRIPTETHDPMFGQEGHITKEKWKDLDGKTDGSVRGISDESSNTRPCQENVKEKLSDAGLECHGSTDVDTGLTTTECDVEL